MKAIAIALTILVSFSIAFGQETYTVTGEVSFKKDDGDIYICICTKGEWAEFGFVDSKISKFTCQIIKMNDEIQKTKMAPFQLTDIPKGTYVIVAHQDVNSNGKTDYLGAMSFPEPWGTYRQLDSYGGRQFDEIKFELNKDIRGIKIEI